MSIGKWMIGLSAFPFGVIFHSSVALLRVHRTASKTAETTQGQRANWNRITSQLKILAFEGLRSPCFLIKRMTRSEVTVGNELQNKNSP